MLTRWLTVVGIILLVGLGAWLGLPEAKRTLSEDGKALAFSLPDLQGKSHGLPEGEVVLLNFWATWCPPCRKEMPSMAALHRKYADQGLKIVAVSVDRDANDLAAFVREYKLPFEVLHDAESAVSHSYGVFRYPETFLIDRQGNVRYHLVGAVEWMSASIIKGIEGLLNESVQRRGVQENGADPAASN